MSQTPEDDAADIDLATIEKFAITSPDVVEVDTPLGDMDEEADA